MNLVRTLVVEDSGVSAAAIKLAISGDPTLRIVGIAGDVDQAVRLFWELQPDVITLDLDIPGGGGLAALSKVKAVAAVAIVVVSALTYEGSRVISEVLSLGADACFDKRRVLSEAEAFRMVLRSAARDGVAQATCSGDGGTPSAP